MDSSVVEPVDVVERLPFDVLDVAPRTLSVDQLSLVETVEALGQRIIVTITLRANRCDDLGFAETLGVTNAEVLNATINDESVRESTSVARVDRHLEGVDS